MNPRYTYQIALYTLLSREISRFLRIWTQTLLPPAITMTLYFIIFGKLIGSQLHTIQGFTYMQYIVPGIVMMSIMTNAYGNSSSSFFGAKFSRSIEEMLISPMPNSILLTGFMLGGALRGLLTGIIVMFIATFFTHVPIHHFGVILIIATLAAMLFSLAGLINAIFAKRFDDISFIPTFILTPLTYLGGIFYSVNQLPPFWRTVSVFNPIFNIIDTFKYGVLGISYIDFYKGLLLICVLFVSLFIWCLFLLQKGTGLRS